MLVGEQPGDHEDRAGGRSSDRWSIAARGARRGRDRRGRDVRHQRREAFQVAAARDARIHDKPSWSEVQACGHWLSLELVAVRPTLVVCLGATAAQSLFGRSARVGALEARQELPGG